AGRDVDGGDAADLGGQPAGLLVARLGDVLPDAGDALDLGAAAQLALGAHLAGDPGDLLGEAVHLVGHPVHRRGQPAQVAVELAVPAGEVHPLRQVAAGDRVRDPGDRGDRFAALDGHVVEGAYAMAPGATVRA